MVDSSSILDGDIFQIQAMDEQDISILCAECKKAFTFGWKRAEQILACWCPDCIAQIEDIPIDSFRPRHSFAG